jgi:hypothetical protein
VSKLAHQQGEWCLTRSYRQETTHHGQRVARRRNKHTATPPALKHREHVPRDLFIEAASTKRPNHDGKSEKIVLFVLKSFATRSTVYAFTVSVTTSLNDLGEVRGAFTVCCDFVACKFSLQPLLSVLQ